jgi:hypothetical protein
MKNLWDKFIDLFYKYNFIKTNSILDVFVHVGLVISLFLVGFMLFFMSFLPAWTHHRDTITVPNLVGMKLDEVKKYLDSRGLDYEIDSVSTISFKDAPLSAFSQVPEAGLRIKQSRKIRISLNPKVFPKTKIPPIIDEPFTDVVNTIKNARLEIGRIQYKSDRGQNVVLEVLVDGKRYKSKEELLNAPAVGHKTKIDLLVADGLGDTEFDVPNLVGLTLEEAETIANGQNLIIQKNYDYKTDAPLGTITRQNPTYYVAGNRIKDVKSREVNKIKAGDIIDVWVAGNEGGRKIKIDSSDYYEQDDYIKDADEFRKKRAKDLKDRGFEENKNKNKKNDKKQN